MKIRFHAVSRGVILFDVIHPEWDRPVFTGSKEECGRYERERAEKDFRAMSGGRRHEVPVYERASLAVDTW